MYRSDYRGPEPPKRLKELIAKRGGLNPFGEPLYRLVHGGFRMTPSGGTWLEWPEHFTTNDRNERDNAPLRRVVEMRWIHSYPGTDAWVLEKWCPPETYGDPKDWYKVVQQGGTVMYMPSERKHIATLGDYPYRGEYENYGYVFPSDALTEAVVLTAIGRIEHAIDKMPSTPEGRMQRKLFNAHQAETLKEQQYKAFCKDILDETDFAMKGNPFIGYGKKHAHSSNGYLKKLGISGHYIS